MKPILTALALGSAFALVAQAQTATTTPVGYVTTVINGCYPNGSRKLNIVAPNFVASPSWVGTVSSVSGNVVTLTNAAFTAGQYNPSNGSPVRYKYHIETADGYWAHIVSNTANSVTLQSGYAANFTAGEAITIRRHSTITDYLGNNSLGLTGSPQGDASAADQVLIIDEDNGGTVTIFPSNILGGTWITDAFEDAGQFPIYPDQGIQISRKSAGNLTLIHAGEVDTNGRQIEVNTGVNVRPIVLPVATTLSALHLYTGNIATGVAASATGDISKADTVSVLVNGETKIYFYSTVDFGGGVGWYDDSFNFVGNSTLPAGAALIIKRTNPTNKAPFIWSNPAPTIGQ